ncbi:MATE family efflux transporter [Natribacillus halophilus]|uniref:Na+-driven multidrug efflux pump n=1 Tax=Natribacillus halophilus TaxID=549003 RepID=A0A1G8N338_9BACI|nr:MATE family efflux transporter [Natribacillus halophilus]SDI74598.1 Na+-driven multidrug efflux pump [Natribacillus halophilus]
MTTANTNPLDIQPVRKVLFRYLFPSMIGMMLMAVNYVIDAVMVGNKLGALSLAGINIASPVYTLFVGISIWIGVGGATLYSQRMGAGEPNRARQIFTHSVVLIIALTIVIGISSLIFREPLVFALGANAETAPYASAYLNVFLMFGLILTLENVCSIFVRNDGSPTLAMAALITTAVSNFIMNFIMLYILELGLREIAFGTIIAAGLGLLVLSIHFFQTKNNLKLVTFRFEKPLLLITLALGFPSFLVELGISIFTISHNVAFSWLLGTDGVAAFSVINYVHTMMLLMFLGLGQGVQPVISYFHGAQAAEKKSEALRLSVITGIVVGAFFMLLGQTGASAIIQVFGDLPDHVADLSSTGIRIFFLAYIFVGLNFVVMTYFQSIGQVKKAVMIIAGRGIVFMLLFLFTLPLLMGANAAWFAVPLAEMVVTGLIVGFYYFKSA